MKQHKCLITWFAAALFMGACSDDDNDYGTGGSCHRNACHNQGNKTLGLPHLVWQSTCAMMYAISRLSLQFTIVSYHP